MSRRLGDDPLSRAKAARAVAEEGGAADQAAVVSSRSSYNDVFFQRRAEQALAPAPAATPEAPEISEISEIPEIREVSSAPQPETTAQAAPVSVIEEAVAKLNAAPVAPAPQEPVAPAPLGEPTLPPASSSAPSSDEQAGPQRGGLLKRLFGKLI